MNDDAQLNFPSYGDLFAAPLTLTSELTLRHKSGQGVFVRVRAWYDLRLESFDAPHGNGANAYTPSIRLEDDEQPRGREVQGHRHSTTPSTSGTSARARRGSLVRVGRQALDWGEGIFYPGINSINPYDFAWLTTTGARIANGGKLPVNRVYANVVGPAGFNIDGFFNLEFRESAMPACGTYYSGLDDGFQPGCNIATAAGLPDRPSALAVETKNYYNGKLYPNGVYPDGAPDAPNATREPSWEDSGWGVSVRKFVEPLATEIGVYYADYTNPFPNNAPVVGTDALTFAINTNFQPIKTLAVSASTGLRNLALSAQLTRHWDYPAQRNAPAFIEGSLSGIGPYGYMKDNPGREMPGFYKMNILQLQYGGVWQFGRLVGLSDATLAAEALMSWNTNNPPTDGPNAERLLRAGNFGLASLERGGLHLQPRARSRTGSSTSATSTASRRRSRWATRCGRRPSSRSSARASACRPISRSPRTSRAGRRTSRSRAGGSPTGPASGPTSARRTSWRRAPCGTGAARPTTPCATAASTPWWSATTSGDLTGRGLDQLSRDATGGGRTAGNER